MCKWYDCSKIVDIPLIVHLKEPFERFQLFKTDIALVEKDFVFLIHTKYGHISKKKLLSIRKEKFNL